MKIIDQLFGLNTEAKLRFQDGTYEVVVKGQFVRCAVTGDAIPLERLRYWSVDRQEAYANAHASWRRTQEIYRRQR